MSAFDDLTLGEVEEITITVLGGKRFDHPDSDPLMLAGAVMWISQRHDEATLTWDAFKARTKMSEIKSFSIDLEAESAMDPMNARNVQAS